MFWFLLFAGVVVVWMVVLALLGLRIWSQGRALFAELSVAGAKLDAAQSAGESTARTHHGRHAGGQA
jgi:hypothetical protein